MTLTHIFTTAQTLRQQVRGEVLTADDAAYEQQRKGFNLATDQYPALIFTPADARDVAASIHFARENGMPVAIQSTGHGMQLPGNDALLIRTSRLASVEVDAVAQTATVGSGVIWEQVIEKTAPHGLAPLLGSSPHVGVIGYTLGGGIGWLARLYGLAADSVRWIEIVTPDGELYQSSATENSDLFWGLRGGGGNFGVVTAIQFSLYPIANLYGGELNYSGEVAVEALRFFREWVKTVPDEMTSSIFVVKIPALPFIPQEMHGKVRVFFRAAYLGDEAEGKKLIQPWLEWHAPEKNTFRQMPFTDIATISNDPTKPIAGIGSNEMFDTLTDEAIDLIVQRTTNPATPLSIAELRHAGGAISRVAPDANAIGNRDAQFYFNISGLVPTEERYHAMLEAIRGYKAALRPYVRGGVYLNFMKGEEASQRARDAYLPETYTRLSELKAKYDPDNLFRFSYNLR